VPIHYSFGLSLSFQWLALNVYCLTWVGRVLKGDDVALFERLAVQQIGPILRLAVKEDPINNTSVL
jgi:hypothetical protein